MAGTGSGAGKITVLMVEIGKKMTGKLPLLDETAILFVFFQKGIAFFCPFPYNRIEFLFTVEKRKRNKNKKQSALRSQWQGDL